MTLLCKKCHRILRPIQPSGNLYQCPDCGRLYSKPQALESGATIFRCHGYKVMARYLKSLVNEKSYTLDRSVEPLIKESTLKRSLKPSLKSLGLMLSDGSPSKMAIRLLRTRSIRRRLQILLELAKDLERQLLYNKGRSLIEVKHFIKSLEKELQRITRCSSCSRIVVK